MKFLLTLLGTRLPNLSFVRLNRKRYVLFFRYQYTRIFYESATAAFAISAYSRFTLSGLLICTGPLKPNTQLFLSLPNNSVGSSNLINLTVSLSGKEVHHGLRYYLLRASRVCQCLCRFRLWGAYRIRGR